MRFASTLSHFIPTGRQKNNVARTSLPTSAFPGRYAVSNRQVAELLKALSAVMEDRQLRWYLFGAQAAILWGSTRYSNDVDVTAELEFADVRDFIDTMLRRGFDLKRDDAQNRVLVFVHRKTGTPLDVIIAGPGLDEEFLDRAIAVNVEGTSVPVITPEDLIVMKALAGRAKDVEDLRAVVDQHRATLDVARIRRLLSLLEQALTRSDMLPLFENAWNDPL